MLAMEHNFQNCKAGEVTKLSTQFNQLNKKELLYQTTSF